MTTYCILNPFLNNKNDNEYVGLTYCGINIMMDNSTIYKDPNIILLLKGEIYNIHVLCSLMNIHLETKPEYVIIEIYKKYGIDYMLQVLDGVFSFILFDFYFENDISKIYVVTDICGIIPIYLSVDKKTIVFGPYPRDNETTTRLSPGCYSSYELGDEVSAEWKISNIVNKPYFSLPNSIVNADFEDYEITSNKLWKCLKEIVLKTTHVYNEDFVNDIADELYSYMNVEDDKQSDILIFNEKTQKQIIFSSKHFLMFNKIHNVTIDNITIDMMNNIFENDIMIRKKIYSAVFESDKKYPFFDKSFIMLYFSIPLSIRDDILYNPGIIKRV